MNTIITIIIALTILSLQLVSTQLTTVRSISFGGFVYSELTSGDFIQVANITQLADRYVTAVLELNDDLAIVMGLNNRSWNSIVVTDIIDISNQEVVQTIEYPVYFGEDFDTDSVALDPSGDFMYIYSNNAQFMTVNFLTGSVTQDMPITPLPQFTNEGYVDCTSNFPYWDIANDRVISIISCEPSSPPTQTPNTNYNNNQKNNQKNKKKIPKGRNVQGGTLYSCPISGCKYVMTITLSTGTVLYATQTPTTVPHLPICHGFNPYSPNNLICSYGTGIGQIDIVQGSFEYLYTDSMIENVLSAVVTSNYVYSFYSNTLGDIYFQTFNIQNNASVSIVGVESAGILVSV